MGKDILTERSLIAVQPSFYWNFDGYHERPPRNPILQQYIGSFYEIETKADSVSAVPVVPDGCMDIIFISDDSETRPYLLKTAEAILGMYVSAHRKVLGIRFKPVGISKFIHYTSDASETYMIPLEEFVEKDNLPIHEFHTALTFEEKCQALENILLANLIEGDSKMELTQNIANCIIAHNGIITVDQLSHEFFYSTRYINKLFNEQVGMAPKRFCEIVQIQNVLNTICVGQETMADIAVQTGYYDQSHMNHVIKKLLNTTSSKLRGNQYFEEIKENLDIKYFY